jgi:ribosomal protein S18 acetylase RimI-like enzyme
MQTAPRYPVEWIERFQTARGGWVTIRPVLPQDEALERVFISEGLTAQSRYQRFQNGLRQLPEAVLEAFTRIDYHHHFALIAESFDGGQQLQVADARFVRDPDHAARAEFALAVADAWQGQGIARRLLHALLRAARAGGVQTLHGDVLRGNQRMLGLARGFGFMPQRHPDDATLVRMQRSLLSDLAQSGHVPATPGALVQSPVA